MRPAVLRFSSSGELLADEGCFILELLNTLDDETISVARARVVPNVTTKLHRLVGIDERYLITDGVGEVEIGDTTKQTVRSGDIVLIPKGTSQRITNMGDTDLSFLCICTPRFDLAAYQALE
ncbi:MAG: cupin domain-containing protein [Gemmatimonadales bacterium]